MSEKLTSIETRIATVAVMPNWNSIRPVTLDRNDTGRNTITSESVVASTARPISRVPAIAACNGVHALFFDAAKDVFEHDDRVVDHHAHHQHQGQHRDVVQREVEQLHDRERGDDRRGNRHRRDERRAPRPHEEQHGDAGQNAADDQVPSNLVQGRQDVARLVLNHGHFDIGGQQRLRTAAGGS